MIETIVGLGGNLGDVAARFAAAEAALERLSGTSARRSSRWASAPLGPIADQPRFVNAALALPWRPADPLAFLAELHAIEAAHGRQRALAQGPRTLDLDLLLIGDLRIELPGLVVPHPRLVERRFVLEPLAELLGPGHVLPDGTTIAAALARVADQDVARLA